MATENDLPAGFLRQRRNLLAFFIGIVVYVAGQGTIENVSALSVPVKLQNPEVVIWFALLGFGYPIWRYWMYSRQTGLFFCQNVIYTSGIFGSQ